MNPAPTRCSACCRPARARCVQESLPPDLFHRRETARIDARCQQFNCGFRRSHFYLAASLRALHNVATQRGNKDGAYLIPVPHDTRKRGANGPIFSNHLSILVLSHRTEIRRQHHRHSRRTEPADDGPNPRQISRIAAWRRWTCSSRCRSDFTCNHLGKPTRGKFATFSFSDSGETCAGMKDFMGRKNSGGHASGAGVASAGTDGGVFEFWQPPFRADFLGGRLREPAEADGLERDVRKALLEEELA